MDALKRSLANEKQSPAPAKAKKPKKRIEGQREMLLPITGGGKRGAKEISKEVSKEVSKQASKQEPKKAEKPVRAPVARSKKAG